MLICSTWSEGASTIETLILEALSAVSVSPVTALASAVNMCAPEASPVVSHPKERVSEAPAASETDREPILVAAVASVKVTIVVSLNVPSLETVTPTETTVPGLTLEGASTARTDTS